MARDAHPRVLTVARADASSSWRAWLVLTALSLLFFQVTAGTFTSLGVVLPDMVASLKWSWTQAGLGFTVLAVACGLASYAPTVFIRALGPRATLLIGAVVLAAGFACLYLVRSVGLYLVGAALAGIGFAMTAIIPGTFILARSFRHSARAFGVYFTVGGLGGAAGPWLYFLAAGLHHHWRLYWAAMAIATLALGALAMLAVGLAPEFSAAEPEAGGDATAGVFRAARDWGVREALATPQFWIIVSAYTAYLLCGVTVNGLSVAHLGQRGVAAEVAGGMLSLQALINAGARAAGGVLAERIDPRRLVIFALACLIGGIAALALARGYPLMLLYAVGIGVGYGLSYLATTVLLLNYFGRGRNLELFSTMCLVSTVAAAGPFVGGFIRDATGGFALAFWLFAAIGALVLVAVVLMRPPRHPAEGQAHIPAEELGRLAKDVL